jgi:hypothetical protein
MSCIFHGTNISVNINGSCIHCVYVCVYGACTQVQPHTDGSKIGRTNLQICEKKQGINLTWGYFYVY